tara:strand:+ start:231 stop:800 length:570 start_codon:yes stop_codon:yes gene_type:complete
MKPLKDIYWVSINKEIESTIELNGTKLYLDSTYDPMRHARQYGEVVEVPARDTQGLDIKKGDKVWFHHFVPDPSNLIDLIEDDNVYQAYNNQIYARERGGEVMTVGHWNLIRQEIAEEVTTDSGIFLESAGKDVLLHGETIFPSEGLKSQGVDVGDRVLFSKSSEYDMDINGETLLRMRDVDILAKYEE